MGSLRPAYVPGELLIKFKPNVMQSQEKQMHSAVRATVQAVYPSTSLQLVKLPNDANLTEAINCYKRMAGVEYVEPNYIVYAYSTPNDPSYSQQWGLSKIGAPTAWDSTTGSSGVVVAVVDTGVNYNHEDLSPVMWRNPREIPGNGIDDDHNGYIDDVYGIDVVNGDTDPLDDHGHGSHCAGIIGAVGNNGKGVAGVNWSTKIIAVKTLAANGSGSTSYAVAAMEYLTALKKAGVNIVAINNSWGSVGGYSQALKDAIDAAGDAGILSCCAAGNGGSDGIGDNNDSIPSYPCNYDSPSVISVAASDSSDNPASFSNYGVTSVDIAAPGVSILSTYKGATNAYTTMSGTSMATPFVTGAVALLYSRSNSLSISAAKSALMSTVDPLPQWDGKIASGGRMNIAAAMRAVDATPSQPDMMIKAQDESSYIGNNIYGTSEGQTKTKSTPAGVPVVYNIKVANDGGAEDSFIIRGTAGSGNWVVHYYDLLAYGNDITGQVIGSGWQANLDGFGYAEFRVEVTPLAGAAAGSANELTLTATSITDTSKTDRVRAVTTRSAAISAVSLAVKPETKCLVNSTVTLTATTTGGGSILYKFRVGYVSGTTTIWTVLRDFASSPTCTWTPTVARSYTLEVSAKESTSGSPYDSIGTISYQVVPAISAVTFYANPASPIYVNTPVALSAVSTGGQNIEYRFKLGKVSGSTTTWTTLKDYSSSNSCTWTPTEAGTYTLAVFIRESGSTNEYDATKTLSFTVSQPLSGVKLAVSPASPTSAGVPIILTPTPTGGANVSYKYRVGTVSGGVTTWAALRDFSITPTCTWTPALQGNYIVEVTARDSVGSNPQQFTNQIAYTIGTTLTEVSLSVDPASPQLVGVPIKLRAAATGGVNVKYKFCAGSTVIQDYSSATLCTWTPVRAGVYSIMAYAREGETSKIVSRSVSYVVIPKLSSVMLSMNPALLTSVGIPVTLTATASGGSHVKYEFRVGSGLGSTSPIRAYSDSPTCTWTPSSTGTYALEVRARENGNTNAYDVMYLISYNVVLPVSGINLVASPSGPKPTGSSITLTASRTGGGTVQYKFRAGYMSNGSMVWTTLKEYSSASTYVWKPTVAKEYTVEVWARELGSSKEYNLTRSINYKIISALTGVNVEPSLSSPRSVNTPITLKASAVGGSNVQYWFQVKRGTDAYTTLQAYSSSATCSWKPTAAGTYTILVYALESGTTTKCNKTVTYTVN